VDSLVGACGRGGAQRGERCPRRECLCRSAHGMAQFPTAWPYWRGFARGSHPVGGWSASCRICGSRGLRRSAVE
jgi:hypothetical protein